MHSSDIFPFKSPEETHTKTRQRCSHTSKQTQSRHTQVCGDVPERDVSVMSTRELRQGIEGVTIIHRSIEGVTIIFIFVCVCWDVRIFTENLMERKIQEIQRAQRQLGWKAAMGRLWWKCPRTRDHPPPAMQSSPALFTYLVPWTKYKYSPMYKYKTTLRV